MVFFREIKTCKGQLDLYRRTTWIHRWSDQESWANVSSLILDGATYESFSGDLSGRDAKWWIGWLAKQPDPHRTSDFKPQPYEQLAKVLRSMGHETEAKEILIEKRKLQRQVRWKYPEHYPRPKAIWRKPFWYLAQCWDWFPAMDRRLRLQTVSGVRGTGWHHAGRLGRLHPRGIQRRDDADAPAGLSQ
jgi:hypothetical protein